MTKKVALPPISVFCSLSGLVKGTTHASNDVLQSAPDMQCRDVDLKEKEGARKQRNFFCRICQWNTVKTREVAKFGKEDKSGCSSKRKRLLQSRRQVTFPYLVFEASSSKKSLEFNGLEMSSMKSPVSGVPSKFKFRLALLSTCLIKREDELIKFKSFKLK